MTVLKNNLPDAIESDILYDRTIAINNSINEVIKTIVEATIIVLVVITMFYWFIPLDFNPGYHYSDFINWGNYVCFNHLISPLT